MANFNSIIKSVGAAASKHSPELLTALGIANMLAGVVFAVRATPKAIDIIKAEEGEKGKPLTKPEIVAAAWKPYIPTAIFCVAGAICFVASTAVSRNRCAALTAAYTLSETALREYSEEVKAAVGEKKEQEIHTKVMQKKIDKAPVNENDIIIAGEERTLCYDAFAGRYFYSDRIKIDKAVNELNRMILSDDFASLNDFYDLVGLESTKLGDMLGWSGRNATNIDARYSSHLASNGQPCLAVCFNIAPKYEYNL